VGRCGDLLPHILLDARERAKVMNLDREEISLIVSALVNDRVGKWGDGREEKIRALLIKINREKESE
jgi:hypothetical protein